MAPTIGSAAMLKHELEKLKPALALPETEDSWESISKAIGLLSELCRSGACDLPEELMPAIRSLSRPLTSAMMSERTRLSGVAIEFVCSMASGLGAIFESMLPIFLPTLLTLCSRTNKVIAVRARACIMVVIETTQLPSILPYFLLSIKDKSISLRLTVAEGTLRCMNCFNPPDLEKDTRVRDIEAIIRAAARDANADVRKVGRQIFEAYKLLLPNRVENFTAPLTPTLKKYLDIKSSITRPQTLARPASSLEVINSTSASASILSSGHSHHENSRPQSMHIRSNSSSAILKHDQVSHFEASANQRIPLEKPKDDTPQPPCAPMRPTVQLRVKPTLKQKVPTVSASIKRPGADLTRTIHTAGPSARPASVKSLFDAHHSRVDLNTQSNSRETAVSGPQRVPLPEALAGPAPSKGWKHVNFTGPRVPVTGALRSISVEPQTKQNSTARLEKAKSVDIRTVGASSSKDKARERRPRARGVTQPTLSQLSRVKALVDRKASLAAAPRSLKGHPTNRKTRILSSSGSHGLHQKAILPVSTSDAANIPLPPSPSGLQSPAPLVLSPVKDLSSEDGEQHCADDVLKHQSDDNQADEPQSADPLPNNQAESVPDDLNLSFKSILPGSLPTHDGGAPTKNESDMLTPHAAISNDLPNLAVTKTPISALLSSIERGFLFTPSSPLSPPQSHLLRDSRLDEIQDRNIPFALHLDVAESLPNNEIYPKKPFMFGAGSGEAGRHALGNMENLNIHK